MASTIPDLIRPSVVERGTVTWTDLFCGGGGSSLGLHHVPGFEIKYAINHWDLAIQAHQTNFPDTDHEISDIETVHPRRFQRTDCAWFSPSCTAQAYCGPRGIDDESVRSRATMWDVPRWTEFHHYDVIVVENVIESKLWCDYHTLPPKTPGGKPRGCSCGKSYDEWFTNMEALGYVGQEVYFNSQFALVPQSRDRLYVVFTRDGIRKPDLDFNPPGYCDACGVVAGVQAWKVPTKGSARDNGRLHQWGRYGKQYVYTCSCCSSVIAPAVLGSWSIIDHTIPIETIGSRKKPIAVATRQRIKTGLDRVGRHKPIQLQVGGNLFERPGYARVWSLDDPLRTITNTQYMAVVMRAGGQAPAPRLDGEPLMTTTAHDRQIGVIVPAGGRTAHAKDLGEPGHTIPTKDRLAIVTLRKGMDAQSGALPGPAQATHADQAIIPLRKHTAASKTDDVVPSITAGGFQHGLLVYNGVPGFVRVLDDAAGTITARDKQSLLVPYNRTGIPISSSFPSPTILAADTASVLEITDEEIDEMYFRMLQWQELQRGQSMHVMPDGTPYRLEARVKTKNGKYRDCSNQDKVKMIGNAVSSPVAAMVGHSIAEALAH